MRFTNLAETLFGSPAKIAVLRELVRSPKSERSGREIARAAGVSAPWAQRVLRELEGQALVDHRRVPPADLWSLNRGHALAAEVRRLLDIDARARQALISSLRPVLQMRGLTTAVLFGSAARREEGPQSDIDVLLVVRGEAAKRRAEQACLDLSLRSLSRFGNAVHAIVYTEVELRRKRSLAFVKAARAEGLVLRGTGL